MVNSCQGMNIGSTGGGGGGGGGGGETNDRRGERGKGTPVNRPRERAHKEKTKQREE